MSDFIIRPLGISDCPMMEVVHRECFENPWLLDAFQQLMSLPTTGAVGVFNENGLLGFCLYSLIIDEAEILTIGVTLDHQGSGIGSQLLGYLLNLLENFSETYKNNYTCHLEVDEKNEAAIHLYNKFGFSPCGRRYHYYKNSKNEVSDAIMMRKII